MDEIGAFKEVYPGDKTTHFRNFKKDSGVEFHDMIFFDNEWRNCRDVARMGVVCVHTPDGMTTDKWEEGLRAFAEAKAAAIARGEGGGSGGSGTQTGKRKKKPTKKKKKKVARRG